MAFFALAASAQAGSFVTIAPPKPEAASSIVALGTPMPRPARDEAAVDPIRTTALPRAGVHLSRSIIVLGEPAKDKDTGKVAVYTLRELARVPMVLRGGEAGGISVTAQASTTAAPEGETAPDGAAGESPSAKRPAKGKAPGAPAEPEPKPAVAPGPSSARLE